MVNSGGGGIDGGAGERVSTSYSWEIVSNLRASADNTHGVVALTRIERIITALTVLNALGLEVWYERGRPVAQHYTVSCAMFKCKAERLCRV